LKFWKISNQLQAEHVPSELVFIRGFQRSGTNWLCNLMNLHPEITCTGEFHFESLFKSINHMLNDQFSYYNTPERKNLLHSQFCNFIESIVFEKCNHNRICIDRTPCSLTDTYMPDYKYLLITRDGRDCIVSWFYHCLNKEIIVNDKMGQNIALFKKEPTYFEANKSQLLNMPNFLRRLSKQWNDRVLSDLTLSDKSNVYMISYERLIKQTEIERLNIYKFLDIEPLQAKSLTKRTSPGFEQHDPKSHYRQGKSNRWKEYFTEQQHGIFISEAGEALQALGYSNNL